MTWIQPVCTLTGIGTETGDKQGCASGERGNPLVLSAFTLQQKSACRTPNHNSVSAMQNLNSPQLNLSSNGSLYVDRRGSSCNAQATYPEAQLCAKAQPLMWESS